MFDATGSYFDFVNDCAIRIKGHRIGIEHVLRDYRDGASADELLRRYPTLTRGKIDATIGPPEFVIESRKKLERCRKTLSAQAPALKISE